MKRRDSTPRSSVILAGLIIGPLCGVLTGCLLMERGLNEPESRGQIEDVSATVTIIMDTPNSDGDPDGYLVWYCGVGCSEPIRTGPNDRAEIGRITWPTYRAQIPFRWYVGDVAATCWPRSLHSDPGSGSWISQHHMELGSTGTWSFEQWVTFGGHNEWVLSFECLGAN